MALVRFKVIILTLCAFVFISVLWPSTLFNGGYITKNETLKYILVWTSPAAEPLNFMEEGEKSFSKRKCLVKNCYVTWNRYLFEDLTDYDVVIIHAPELARNHKMKLPWKRSPKQLYIFASMESSNYYPMPELFEDYFNVTWTYKLNSDIYFGYIVIRNKDGEIVGPSENMDWLELNEMSPINDTVREKLKNKKKLAAWFVSNCNALSRRRYLVDFMKAEFKKKYPHAIDIYGSCGKNTCPITKMKECMKMVENDYFFYLALENSFSEDYVTEKLLRALQNYAIPIVYGGADYRRFMPNGVYLKADLLSTPSLARRMLQIINNTDFYYDYFKWHNHYSYHNAEETSETDPFCKLCEYVNQVEGTKIVHNLAAWWNT